MATVKEIKDFKSTPYYEYYTKKIEDISVDLIKDIMKNKWNDRDKKYSWNDVLKKVYEIVDGELKEFKDSLDLNPYKEERDLAKEKEYEENLDKEARRLVWMT